MRVRYSQGLGFPPAEKELSEYLKPTYTGSAQGSIEQLESELAATNETVGKLLAWLVESDIMSLGIAEDICGKHSSYRQYRYQDRILIP